MRLYHQLYRRKNPPPRRALSGARKKVYDDLMALMRVQNPAVPIARIRRGETLEPGIVTGPGVRMTQTEKEKKKEREKAWKRAFEKLGKWEVEEEALRAEREHAKKWREEKKRKEQEKLFGKTGPMRMKALRDAAERELAAKEEYFKKTGVAFTKAKREALYEEIASGVAARWNLLAELNRRVAEGKRALIPLRNTVAAEIEGRLSGRQFDYTVKEALAELTAAEIRGVQSFIADLKRKEGHPAYQPVTGEEFIARKSRAIPQRVRGRFVDIESTPIEFFSALSRAQIAAVKEKIRTRGIKITAADQELISADPKIQRALLKRLGVPIERRKLQEFLRDPKEISLAVAAAVGKDPEVVKAIGKMQLFDRIKAYVADTPEVRMSKKKLEAIEKHDAESLEILRKSFERERAGGTLGSKKPIFLAHEAAARKEAEAYAVEMDPRAMRAARERDIPKNIELWDRLALGIASDAQKLKGDDKKRGKRIEKVIKDHEKLLKKYHSVKKLKAAPYIPPSFLRMSKPSIEKAEQTERERLALFYDDYAKAALKKLQTGSKTTLKNLREHIEILEAKMERAKDPQIKKSESYLKWFREAKRSEVRTVQQYRKHIQEQLGKYRKYLREQAKGSEIKTVKQYREMLLRQFQGQVKARTGNYPAIKTVEQYRESLARRLYDSLVTRWRNTLMSAYESHGGKYLTASERRQREKALKRPLGAAFPMGGGLNGIIAKENGKYKWKVFDDDGKALMWGTSTTHSTAAAKLNIAHRVTYNIFRVATVHEPGFDFLSDEDRKWLSANQPNVDLVIKKVLWSTIGEKRKVDPDVLKWIAAKEVLEEPMQIKFGDYTKAADCKRMKPGEKRAIPSKGFTIFVERSKSKTKKRYDTVVLTKDGEKSGKYRFPDCKTVITRAHSIAGALKAGKKVVAAVGNPAAMTRLENAAKRYFRKQNPKKNPFGGPKLPRRPAEVGAIEDLSAMIQLPAEPDEAYRLGYYAGIIKGIDTCGIQNFMKRRALRKEFQQRLLDAVISHQETLTERVGKGRRGRTAAATDWE